MSSLQGLGQWGSNLLGQAQAQLAPAASSLQQGADLLKKGTKAVKASIKENLATTAFVGSSHRLDDPRGRCTRQVQETAFLAEGAFGAVMRVVEAGSGKEYALKKIRCQENVQVASSLEAAQREASILTTIPAHPNIIACFGYSVESHGGGASTVKLLLELCSGGHLLDFMDKRNGKLSMREVLEPFRQITEAVRHLHAQQPPIQHRDLKVENVLRGRDGTWKLCDFGSCSTDEVPAEELSKGRLLQLQEEIDKTVTMLYRPPEMVDLELNSRNNYTISTQVDIWMLGCILYTLAFYRHPFQDMPTAMAISNGKYYVPGDHELAKSAKLCGLIHWLLALDPQDRPSASKSLEILDGLSKCKYEDFLAAMPPRVQAKIKKLEIYSARRDTGDLDLPDDLAAAIAVAGSIVKGGAKPAPRPVAPAGRPAAPRAAPPPSGDGFDITSALAGPAAAPAQPQAQQPQQQQQQRQPLAPAPAAVDLLSFDTPPMRAAAPPAAAAAPPADLGDLLGLAQPGASPPASEWSVAAAQASSSAAMSPGSDWSADFGAFSPHPPLDASPPTFQFQPSVPSASHSPSPPLSGGGGMSPAAAFDFADFAAAPPPPAACLAAAPPVQPAAGPSPIGGNLLDF